MKAGIGGVRALGEHGASALGSAYDLQQIPYFIHKAGHGLLGGAIGALVSDDRQAGFIAGAMGAVVAEVVAEELFSSFQKSLETLAQEGRQSGRTYTKARLEARLFTDLKIAVDTGKMASALVSFLAEQDVQVSIDQATTAIENNFLLYTPKLIDRFLDDVFLSRMEALAQVSFDVLVDLFQKDIPSDRYQGFAKGWNTLLGRRIDVVEQSCQKKGISSHVPILGPFLGPVEQATTGALLRAFPEREEKIRSAHSFGCALASLPIQWVMAPETYGDAVLFASALKGAKRVIPFLTRSAQTFAPLSFESNVVRLPARFQMRWKKGIEGQGMPWEDYVGSKMHPDFRLPKNYKTFDFYDPSTRTAVSAKTLDTLTPARLGDPKQVYTSLKKNIDDAVRFEEYELLKVPLNRSMIDVRRLEVAIPQQTTPAQIEQIKRAIDYGQTKGVDVRITIVE